ncbi:MAG: hypothetical protein IKN31_02335 [Bacteroidales bacterium]|nr:hypothetical protein [Bacteroidales bacterium]
MQHKNGAYCPPELNVIKLENSTVLLNGSNQSGQIDNPGISGPGEIWFE